MKASRLIAELQQMLATYGDLEIVGGYLADDRGPERVIPVTDDGTEAVPTDPRPATGLFLE